MMVVLANNTKLVFIVILCLFGNKQFVWGKLSLDEVSSNVNVDNDGDNVIIANDIDVSGNNPSSSDSIDYESLARQLEVLLEGHPTPTSYDETCSEYGKQTLKSGMEVFCDGKWTVFQKRFNGSVDFDRNWDDYKNGFGSLDGEFWYGLENIYLFTKDKECRVRFDLWDFEGDYAFAEYSGFSIEDESQNYRLHIAGYSGTAGDGILNDSLNLDGMQFSTLDRDNDLRNGFNCAQVRGGFWHNACAQAHPNNVWTPNQTTENRHIIWLTWKGHSPLKETVIKMRCN